MRAESWNGGARREGYCWVTAGKHAPIKWYKKLCLKNGETNGSTDFNKTHAGCVEHM
jgi:hypothetical protein